MLIDIHQLVQAYNTLVTSPKYSNITENDILKLYKALVKRIINIHESDNYNLNMIMISDFMRNASHLLTLKPLNIKKHLIPRQLADLKQYHPTTKSSQMGPYKVIKVLGSGQFGKVYLVIPISEKTAKQTTKQPLYALKRIDLLDKLSSPQKIKKEIDTLKRLSEIKPQLAPKFVTAFIQNNYVNIVQEYINCGTLSEYTKTHKLTPKMKKQIRSLISNLHKYDIFHKDLHTENILVKCDSKTKEPIFLISDFGESKTLKNIQNDDYLLIQNIRNSNESIDHRISKIPPESMLFELILDEILNSKVSPITIPPYSSPIRK